MHQPVDQQFADLHEQAEIGDAGDDAVEFASPTWSTMYWHFSHASTSRVASSARRSCEDVIAPSRVIACRL